jgi:hypothetical protein
MSRQVRPDPLLEDPVGWFFRLVRAVNECDWGLAIEAQRQLARLGWDVRQRPRRTQGRAQRQKGAAPL